MKQFHRLWFLLFLFYGLTAKAQTGDSLVINLKNGQRITIPLSQIRKITFDSLTASVKQSNPTHQVEILPSYPNPLSNATTIEFKTTVIGNAELEIFDSKGEIIRKLELKNCVLGKNRDGLNRSGKKVSSGSYFYKLIFMNEILAGKMEVVK
jgi:hypothetical protein